MPGTVPKATSGLSCKAVTLNQPWVPSHPPPRPRTCRTFARSWRSISKTAGIGTWRFWRRKKVGKVLPPWTSFSHSSEHLRSWLPPMTNLPNWGSMMMWPEWTASTMYRKTRDTPWNQARSPSKAKTAVLYSERRTNLLRVGCHDTYRSLVLARKNRNTRSIRCKI